MRQFIAEDDASAGKGIPLTGDVVQHLTWIGNTVGPVLDEVRKAIHLTSLSKVKEKRNGEGNAIHAHALFIAVKKNYGAGAIHVCTVENTKIRVGVVANDWDARLRTNSCGACDSAMVGLRLLSVLRSVPIIFPFNIFNVERFSLQVTLAEDARHRDVLEQALRSLVECLPSIDTAEVWQLDSDGSIRCVQGLAAEGEGGGKIYRSNERVNRILHADDVEEFSLQMESVPGVDDNSGKEKEEQKTSRGKPEKKPNSASIPEGLVIRPKRTPGILAAAPFCDYSFKVGRSWIGADRLARGFALVLRENVPNRGRGGTAVVKAGGGGSSDGDGITISHRRGGPSKAGGATTEAARDDERRHVEDGDFSARVAREIGVALSCVRGREKRAAIRVQALKKLSEVCLKDKPSGKEAKEAVLAEISAVLPGCRAYVGVLQPGGHTLLYKSATASSAMKGRELRRGEGISLDCLDDPEGQIRVIQHRTDGASDIHRGAPAPPSLQDSVKIGGPRPPNFSVADRVEVWYASSWLYASIVRAWGHQCYDVRYEAFRETEAGVPGWRLREVFTLEHLKVKVCWGDSSEVADGDGDDGNDDDSTTKDVHRCSSRDNKLWPWPFVCAPLRSAGNRVGVLGVDGWSGVELGRVEEVHPEKAVVAFLRETGSLLANALYAERRDRGLSALRKTLRGQDTTQNGALEALIMLLRETVTFRTRVDVLETRSADPGAIFCRGTWEDTPQQEKKGNGQGGRQGQSPARVFDVSVAPRVEELCLTPAQLKRLGDGNKPGGVGGGGPLSPQRKQQSLLLKEITPYQRDMHLIARDGPGAKNGLQARALTTCSRRGEIVGRFQRLFVRAGGGRPSADGWFLVRVARNLPEDAPQEPSASKTTKSTSQSAVSRGPKAANTSTGSSEDGDIWLLSEMCRRLEVGFMAIASREQRALSRAKALDRVLNCCKGFNVTAASSPLADSRSVATDDHVSGRKAKTAEQPAIGSKDEGRVSRAAATPGTKSDTFTPAAGQSQPQRTVGNISNGGGKSATKTSTGKEGGASTSAKGGASTSAKSPSSPPVVAAAAISSAAMSLDPKEPEVSSKFVMSAAVALVVEEDRTATSKTDGGLIFSTPVQPPTPAETSDGRKGVLVTLKDARLAVLVYQGDKRVAVVEQPGGRQQVVPESEVGRLCRTRTDAGIRSNIDQHALDRFGPPITMLSFMFFNAFM